MTATPLVGIVDDNPRMRQSIELALKANGLGSISFESGHELFLYLLNCGDGLQLILLDLMMPLPDGLDCLRELRASGYQGSVVICTALDEPRFRAQALAEGAAAYVLKADLLDDPLATIGMYLA
jgi:DNA-binding response OmpR family regulator